MKPESAKALEEMSQGAFRVWMGGRFDGVDARLSRLENRRSLTWLLTGGGLTGGGITMWLTGVVPKLLGLL